LGSAADGRVVRVCTFAADGPATDVGGREVTGIDSDSRVAGFSPADGRGLGLTLEADFTSALSVGATGALPSARGVSDFSAVTGIVVLFVLVGFFAIVGFLK
jgi:hypothetical protein